MATPSETTKTTTTTPTKKEKKIAFSVDIGYGHIKWSYISNSGKVECGKFPNAVYRITKKSDINEENLISYNGNQYLVGDEALNYVTTSSRTFQQMCDNTFLLIYYAILDACLKVEDVTTIVTGISLVNAREENNKGKQIYKDLLQKGDVVNGETIKFENVLLATQGQGIYWDYIQNHMEDENVIIVDIGMSTLDYLVYLNNRASGEKSDANKMGVNRMTTALGGYISRKLNIDVPPEQLLNKYLLQKKMKHKAEIIDLTEEINKISINYINEIITELRTKIGDTIFNSVDAIVFAGGGSYYLPDVLPEPHFHKIESPFEFSNSRGYLKALDDKFMSILINK